MTTNAIRRVRLAGRKLQNTKVIESLIHGLFYSKLLYCLPLFGNVWAGEAVETGVIRHSSFTKSHLRALQTLQNKLLRNLTGHNYDTPVKILLETSDMLSVNQLIAFYTIMLVFQIKLSNQPLYLAKRLGFCEISFNERNRRHDCRDLIQIKFNLSTAREGFIYRASKLWSALPLPLKMETKKKQFKKGLKTWVETTIPAIPY